MSVSGVGPAGMDPMGESQSAQSVSLSSMVGLVEDSVNNLKSCFPMTGASQDNVSMLSHHLKGEVGALEYVFTAAGCANKSGVSNFLNAASDFQAGPSSTTLDALETSLTSLSDTLESNPISLTPKQSEAVIKDCISRAGEWVDMISKNIDTSPSFPGLNVVAGFLNALLSFPPVEGMDSSLKIALEHECSSVVEQIDVKTRTPSSLSDFCALFSQWSSSFLSDVEGQLS